MGLRTRKTLFSLAVFSFVILNAVSGQTGTDRSYTRMDLLDDQHEIEATDRLRYQVLEEQSPPVVLAPDQNGEIRFPPLLRSVPVVGKTAKELAHEVKALLEVDFFYRATVVVEVTESSFREHATVYGQVVGQGGRVMLPENGVLTLSRAISQVGGFAQGADMENVTVLRKNPDNPDKEDRIVVNVAEIINEGLVQNDIPIEGQDVIIVGSREEMGGRYSVLGAVNQPGLYTIEEEDLTVSDAILLAGGFTDVARESRVKLTRGIEGSEESEIYYINVRRILEDGIRSEDMLVKPDDIINVSERIIVF